MILLGLLTVAMVLSGLAYSLAFEDQPPVTQLLIPFSYVSLGMLVKYGDQAFDTQSFNRRNALVLAVPAGLWMGALIALDADSATIFIGLLLGLLVAAKYDNIAFKLGFVVAVVLGGVVLAFQPYTPSLIGVIVVSLAAYLDERVNDMELVERDQGLLFKTLRQRPLLKIAVLVLCATGILSSYLYFFAFLGFDFGYAFVERVSLNRRSNALE